MEPITLIVTALAAGASSGAIEGLASSVKENAKAAFEKLHALVQRRLGSDPRAEVILDGHQEDPDTYQAPLTKMLTEAGAADDSDLLEAAKALMELVDQQGSGTGKYTVNVSNSQGVQVGDYGTQTNNFS